MAAGFTTIQIKDGNGFTQTYDVYSNASGQFFTTSVLTDALGNVLGLAANPLVTSLSSSTAVIGHVVVDSGALTANIGTTNGLALDSSLTTIAGKITHCDTTNVTIASALPAGSAVIGHVIVDSGTVGISGTVAVSGSFFQATQPVSGTFWQTTQPVSGAFWQTTQPVSGAFWQTTQPVSLSSLPALVAGSAKIGIVTTDQTTHGTTDLVAADITKVAGSAIAQGHGTAATAIRVELPTDGTGVVGLAAGTNTVGGVTVTGSATGGASTFHLVAAVGTNASNVKASAGTLKGVQVYNFGTTPVYLKLYNTGGSPTPGSGTPQKVVGVPANSSSLGGGAVPHFAPEGIAFSTGIGFTITGGIADNDTTSISASSVLVEIDYK